MGRVETPGDPTPAPAASTESGAVWTIVVAGGSGRRFGRAKQYEWIGPERMIDRSRRVATDRSDGVVVVVPPDDVEREGGVAGGSTRSASVRAGLAAVPAAAGVICVHDAARPFAGPEVFDRVVAAVRGGADAAIPAIPVTDTVKQIAPSAGTDHVGAVGGIDGVVGVVVATPDRDLLVAVQTPQAFRASRLREAHASGAEATDDAALVEAAGGTVVVVAGDVANRKITEPDDLAWAIEHQRRTSVETAARP